MDEQGSVMCGSIDLRVETTDGHWIIDHKSDLTDDLDTRAQKYLRRLLCYRDGVRLAEPEKSVHGLMINWISSGKISMWSADG